MADRTCDMAECRATAVVAWNVGGGPHGGRTLRVCKRCSKAGVKALVAGSTHLAGRDGGRLIVTSDSGERVSLLQPANVNTGPKGSRPVPVIAIKGIDTGRL